MDFGSLPVSDIRREFADETPTVQIGQPAAVIVTPPASPTSAVRAGFIAHAKSLSLTETGRSLGKWIWAWPLVAAAILAIAGFWARTTIERVMRAQMASELLALARRRRRGAAALVRGPPGRRLDRRQ